MSKIVSCISGIIFGVGLSVSNMINPEKVLGFLDIFGTWDPSLGFVMGGAIFITAPLLYFFKKRNHLILASQIELPNKKNIDFSLVVGALLFGVGWGMVGFCPGPAISSLALLNTYSIYFVLSLIGGFLLTEFVNRTISRGSKINYD